MTDDTVVRTLTVPVSAGHAFDVFTHGFAQWWPPEYTWSGESLQWIGMEPRIAGACFEIGPDGFRCDFGRILLWQPPARLVFTWQIGPSRVPVPDAQRAGEVEVSFSAVADGSTRVDLEHRYFARHGEEGTAYRAAMDDPRGWSYILGRYATLLA